MTDSQQQNDSFDMNEIMALAASKFGGIEFENNEPPKEPEPEEPPKEPEPTPVEPQEPAPVEPPKEPEPAPVEPTKQAEIDPFLKALLEQSQPKQEEKQEPVEPKEPTPEVKPEPVAQPAQQNNQPVHTEVKALQPNDLLDDATRQMLMEYRDLDEQSFAVMDQVAAAHAKANTINLQNEVAQVVTHLHAQIQQQNQIIAQLQNQLSGVNTRITAPTLEQDIEAMKNDPSVAAYLPYMQNVLNGNDSNAKMQLVNTWKQSKTQASAAPAAVQPAVVERRTTNVNAAAEATAAMANKTQSSMVQPTDEIKEGMELAMKAFGPNR